MRNKHFQFQTLLMCFALWQAALPLQAFDKFIAVTIDDLPFTSRQALTLDEKTKKTRKLLHALQQHQVVATGFVSENRLLVKGEVDGHIALLTAWLDAGMQLGNHNFGHIGLWDAALEEVQDAVIRGDTVTSWLLAERNRTIRYYRPPYTQTGKNDEESSAFEEFLQSRGYQLAPFTVEHDDYLFSCVYDHYLESGDLDALSTIRAEYLDHLDTAVDAFETMSAELFNRQIAHIWLIHANSLNADTLADSLDRLALRGYRFVSLDQALQDEVYALPVHASGKYGPSWLNRWARAANRQLSVYGQPDPSGWTAEQFSQHCR